MQHQGTQVLHTRRLILRPFRLEDAQDMFNNWASDPEVVRFLTWPAYKSADTAVEILTLWTAQYKDPGFYQWAIALKDSDIPIGSISVVDFENDVPEIGYCIGRNWWGQGITPEALEAVIGFLFREVGADQVTAKHAVENPASGRVMEKCGMVFTGMRPKAYQGNSGLADVNCYSIGRG